MSIFITQSEIDDIKKSHATSVALFKFDSSKITIEDGDIERLARECPTLESIFVGSNPNPVWRRERKVQKITAEDDEKTPKIEPMTIDSNFEPPETDESDGEENCTDGIHCDDGIHCEPSDTQATKTCNKIESFMMLRSQQKVVYNPDLPYHYMSMRHVWCKK
jgi:hypothetical protein